MTFDPTKPYACRIGYEAAIGMTTRLAHSGHVMPPDGHPIEAAWELDGTSMSGHQLDLVNIPEPSKAPERVWVNVYPSGVLDAHASRENANLSAGRSRIECAEYVRVQP